MSDIEVIDEQGLQAIRELQKAAVQLAASNAYPSATGGSLAGPGFSFPEVTPQQFGEWATRRVPDEVLNAPIGEQEMEGITDKIYEKVEPYLMATGGLLAGVKAPLAAATMKIGDKTVSKLDVAKKMVEKGYNEDLIWQKTGWRSDPKGNWAFEIDDSKMNVKMNIDDIWDLKSQYVSPKLNQVIEHEDLFSQYPSLKSFEVKLTPNKASSIDIPNKTIWLSETANDVKETLIHEIQHKIQDIEGWPKGSPSSGYNLKEETYNRLLDQNHPESGIWPPSEDAVFQTYRDHFGEFQSRDSASRANWDAEMRKTVRPYSSEFEPKSGWIYKGGQGNAEMASERPLIDKAMQSKYASGVDITDDWKAMSPKERQDAVANGLHIETDRSGRRIIGNLAEWKRTQNLRDKVLSKRKSSGT